MGTWGVGPFEEDSAADWVIELDAVEPEDRAGMIERTLRETADHEDYLEQPTAAEAVAAAAVTAELLSGDGQFPPGAPQFLVRGEHVELEEGVSELATRALDRVVGEDSEWRELWAESGELANAIAMVDGLRRRLS